MIIMVTARGHVEDRIEGISAGADAYLVKPINLKELKATVDHLNLRLRQHLDEAPPTQPQWQLNQLSLELICPNANRINLTVTESSLLKALLDQAGQPVSRDKLCSYLPPGSQDDTRRLDSILSRLRSKAKDAGVNLPIHTLRNKGYTFAGNRRASDHI